MILWIFRELETTPGESDYIVTEIKEEGVDDDSYCGQKIHNSEDGENNTVDDSLKKNV